MIFYSVEDLNFCYTACGLRVSNMVSSWVFVRNVDGFVFYLDFL